MRFFSWMAVFKGHWYLLSMFLRDSTYTFLLVCLCVHVHLHVTLCALGTNEAQVMMSSEYNLDYVSSFMVACSMNVLRRSWSECPQEVDAFYDYPSSFLEFSSTDIWTCQTHIKLFIASLLYWLAWQTQFKSPRRSIVVDMLSSYFDPTSCKECCYQWNFLIVKLLDEVES